MVVFCYRRGTKGCCASPSFYINFLLALTTQVGGLLIIIFASMSSCSCSPPTAEYYIDGELDFMWSGYLWLLAGCIILIFLVGIYNYYYPMNSFVSTGNNSYYAEFSQKERILDMIEKKKGRSNKYLVHYVLWNYLFFGITFYILLAAKIKGEQMCYTCCAHSNPDPYNDCFLLDVSDALNS